MSNLCAYVLSSSSDNNDKMVYGLKLQEYIRSSAQEIRRVSSNYVLPLLDKEDFSNVEGIEGLENWLNQYREELLELMDSYRDYVFGLMGHYVQRPDLDHKEDLLEDSLRRTPCK